jgi:hypothetical protein
MAEFFLKTTSSIIGPGDTIILPKISKLVDFECELCAVIGKRARKVTEDQSLNYVFGYTICWDISQEPVGQGQHNAHSQRFDSSVPWGWVDRDEIDEPQNLSIKVLQNGKEVMTAHTSDMICGLREHIRFLTSCLTLRPGDLITTGTPAGVSKLNDGDHLKGTIEKIVEMELRVRAETGGRCSLGAISDSRLSAALATALGLTIGRSPHQGRSNAQFFFMSGASRYFVSLKDNSEIAPLNNRTHKLPSDLPSGALNNMCQTIELFAHRQRRLRPRRLDKVGDRPSMAR